MHKGGWSIIVNEFWDFINVDIKLRTAILNSSNNRNIDLDKLGKTIERQLKNSYEMRYMSKRYQTATTKSGLDYMVSKSYSRLAYKRLLSRSLFNIES